PGAMSRKVGYHDKGDPVRMIHSDRMDAENVLGVMFAQAIGGSDPERPQNSPMSPWPTTLMGHFAIVYSDYSTPPDWLLSWGQPLSAARGFLGPRVCDG